MVYVFPTNKILPFCLKRKEDLILKNTLKDVNSGIKEKNDIHTRKCVRTSVINVINTSNK